MPTKGNFFYKFTLLMMKAKATPNLLRNRKERKLFVIPSS